MAEIRIGKKCFQMRLISWDDGGAALLPLEDAATAGTMPAERKIIAVRPDGRVLRQFPPRVQPAAFDRRRLA
jgi:hypothetical protein